MSQDAPRTQASIRRSRWPGWIWAVPIAAVAIVVWLIVRNLAQGGVVVTVYFDQAARAKAGDTRVFYRGLDVGKVDSVKLTRDDSRVEMKLRLKSRLKPLLRQGTRFWLIGANPSLSDLKSLVGVISGPSIGMAAGTGQPARTFVGTDEPPAVKGPASPPQFAYLVRFKGDVGGLKVGGPVKLRGFPVGKVADARLVYDAATGQLSAPVLIDLDPAAMGLPAGSDRAAVDRALSGWIRQGLRAQLAEDPPLIGAPGVSLEFAAGVPPASLQSAGPYPEIPATASADIGQLAGKADQILTKIDAVPIERIGQDLRVTADHLRTLASSPKLQDSVDHLDDTLSQVDRTVHQVSPQISDLVQKLRRAADAADQTAAAADQLIAGSPTAQDDIPSTLHELTETARSIRSLADYLDRHPESLIKGRKKGRP